MDAIDKKLLGLLQEDTKKNNERIIYDFKSFGNSGL